MNTCNFFNKFKGANIQIPSNSPPLHHCFDSRVTFCVCEGCLPSLVYVVGWLCANSGGQVETVVSLTERKTKRRFPRVQNVLLLWICVRQWAHFRSWDMEFLLSLTADVLEVVDLFVDYQFWVCVLKLFRMMINSVK